MDDEIRAARDWPRDRQRELFFKLARHLFDDRTREPEEDRFDTSDDEQWLDNLATWFEWPDDLSDEQKARAARDSFHIPDSEIQDALGADEA
jgi:hypothetical protein